LYSWLSDSAGGNFSCLSTTDDFYVAFPEPLNPLLFGFSGAGALDAYDEWIFGLNVNSGSGSSFLPCLIS
jgi:hypothetical protein